MSTKRGRETYRNDIPYWGKDYDVDPSAEDIRQWVRSCVKNPEVFRKGITIYNFSTHEINYKRLFDVLPELTNEGVYVIPLQINTWWSFARTLLPRTLRSAPNLIHSEAEDGYMVKQSLLDQDDRRNREIRSELAHIVSDQGGGSE